MALFTIAAAVLLLTMVAAPIALVTLGVRQYRWWSGARRHEEHIPPRRQVPLLH